MMRSFFSSVVECEIANTYELINSDVLIIKCARVPHEFDIPYFATYFKEKDLSVHLIATEGNYLAFGCRLKEEIERIAEAVVLKYLEKGISVTLYRSSLSASKLLQQLKPQANELKLMADAEIPGDSDSDLQFDSSSEGSDDKLIASDIDDNESCKVKWSTISKTKWETQVKEFKIIATDLEKRLDMFQVGVIVPEPTNFSRMNMRRKNTACFGLPDVDIKQLDPLIDAEL